MLRRLIIEDFALIARAEITFADAATVFTGETGSGKTMVLGALAFALGERASGEMLRRGAARASVTLEFDPQAPLRAMFDTDGFAIDADENATIVRELSAAGKSSLRLNGRAATAAYVRDVAPSIADFIGQHEAQRLLSPAYHVDLLDRFAGEAAHEALERVQSLHRRRAALREDLQQFESGERRIAEQLAYARFGLAEIEAAAPQAGEDERLTQRRRLLDDAERIAQALRSAHEALAGEEVSAGNALGSAAAALASIESVAPQFAEFAGAASALQSEAGDLAALLAREQEALEFDPGELDAINARLDALDTLKRKYGATLSEVVSAATEFRVTIDRFDDAGGRKAHLEAELLAATAQLEEAAEALSRLRRGAADRLSKAVEKELGELALRSARFGVEFETLTEIGADGAEHIEFVFAANKGEALRPLSRVASGGELSRVLLAVVVVLANVRGRAALVFDEIDAGIGGATATAVGVRIGRLAQNAQVVCVTHLAQIASWADAHYVLQKREEKRGTTIEVEPIEREPARAGELARMLSGESHDAALEHARTLLAATNERRTAAR